MTGTIDTMSLSEASKVAASGQSRLTSFGGTGNGETTFVGIARSDKQSYLDTVDETETRLAPPKRLFSQWYETKKNLEQTMLDANAHNEAMDRIDYFERFDDHLNSRAAQEALTTLTERVRRGEDIVLVCYCDGEKQCHRHPVAERIKARLHV